jgi:outer membrane lipoprotein LolB
MSIKSIRVQSQGLMAGFALGLGVLLSACTQGPSTSQANNQAKAPTASAWQSWQASGVVGFHDAKQANSAHFQWQQYDARQFDLRLQGAFGVGALAIHATNQSVSAKTAQGKTLTASTPEALVAQATGWHLPVGYLYYWLRALPVPGVAIAGQTSANGHLTQLRQAGWTVVYQSYSQQGAALLPQRLVLTQPALTVTVIVNQWQYQPG